jgi:hypothetical protein
VNNELRRARLLKNLDLQGLSGLEIRPLAAPLVPQAPERDIAYADRLGEDDLVRELGKDAGAGDESFVHIDYIWDGRRLSEVVGTNVNFDYVVAAHVIEHAPNLLGWLRQIGEVLRPGGRLLLVVPDRRFMYDIKRTESTLSDVLAADILDLTRPDVRQVVDAVWNGANVDLAAAWAGVPSPESSESRMSVDALTGLCKSVVDRGDYVDVHCWVFTPTSFAQLMKEASELGLVEMGCEFFVDTVEAEFEFCVSLIAGEDQDKVIASWRTMEWEAGREARSLALRHARRASTLHASRVLLGGHDADGHYLGGESTSVVQDLSSWLSTDGLEVAPDEEVSHFWRLATETWRISRGLKPLSIEHPELSARLVPRNGFRPSSWGELAGSIDQIRVRQLGAMGNSVIQIMNARDLAGQFGISDLAVSDAWFLPTGRSDLHGGVRLMNLDSARAQEAGQAQAGVSVLGNFFRSSEFAPVLGVSPEEEFERLMNGLVGLADIDDLARLVNNHLDVGDPLSADHLVIHLRAGDVFRDGEVPGYGQPPLAYYLKILGSRPWAAVSVVFEDASNPVIAPLVEHVRRSPVDSDIVSGQLEHDVAFLLRARTLVAGRGTFIPAVSALSKYAEVVYCFERLLGAVGGKRLQVKPVIDVSGAYVRSVMNYNWTNSEEQRKLMLEYAVDDLAWQES